MYLLGKKSSCLLAFGSDLIEVIFKRTFVKVRSSFEYGTVYIHFLKTSRKKPVHSFDTLSQSVGPSTGFESGDKKVAEYGAGELCLE